MSWLGEVYRPIIRCFGCAKEYKIPELAGKLLRDPVSDVVFECVECKTRNPVYPAEVEEITRVRRLPCKTPAA